MLRTFADDNAPSVSAIFNVSITHGLYYQVLMLPLIFILYFLFLWVDNVA